MSRLTDAIAVTGAVSGKVISEQNVQVQLTPAQKAALAAFVSAIPGWKGQPGNVNFITIARDPIVGLVCNVSGYVVHADGNAAVAAVSAGDATSVLGVVP